MEKMKNSLYPEAILLFTKAIEISPNYPYAWYDRGFAKFKLKN